MRIQELWELNPDFEPLPPLQYMPPQPRSRFKTDGIVGDGTMRWCACKVFEVYLGSGKFGDPIRPGETISPETLRPCDAITRGYFHKNHQKMILNYLAMAKGYGYLCCFTFDRTPRKPFEIAEMFGLTITPADITFADNMARWATRQNKDPFANRAPKSAATKQADSIARLL